MTAWTSPGRGPAGPHQDLRQAGAGCHGRGHGQGHFPHHRRRLLREHPPQPEEGLCARIDKADVRTPALFEVMQREGGITEHDMFNTFNMGVGMVLTVAAEDADKTIDILQANGERDAYRLGTIVEGDGVELG